MALTRASALWYWDAAYGIAPVVGGAPEFDRESGAYFQDARGQFRGPVPIDTPIRERILVGSEYRTALRLEPAATNLIPRNRQRFAGWTAYEGAVATITQGQTIPGWTPDGAATRIQTSGGTSPLKYYLEVGGATRGTTHEALSVVVYNIGTHPVVISGWYAGADVTVQPGQAVHAQSATAAADATKNSRFRFVTQDAAHSIDILAYAPAVVAQPYCSSLIYDPHDTDGALVSRAADLCAFRAPPAWQPMAGFGEFIAGMDGNGGITLPRVLHIGPASGAHPSLQIRHGTDTLMAAVFANASQYTAVSGSAVIAAGDRVRVGWALRSDARAYIAVRVNDGAVAAATASSALPAGIPASMDPEARMHLSGVGAANRGRHYHVRHHIVTLADMTNQPGVATAADFLAELEDYYLDPAGNLI